MIVKFYKYQGTGNDFIILDNRTGEFNQITNSMVARLCNRHLGIGGDGLMLMNKAGGYDFEMIYYNADGNPGTMCGNGGRCMVSFARKMGILQFTYRFKASDGDHEAELNGQVVRLKMNDVREVEVHNTYMILNTGSPHFVRFVNDLENVDVVETGREIRNSKKFLPDGINVDFVEPLQDDSIFVRTYERGVEDETLSCGTGVTAAALVSAHNPLGFNQVFVHTPGGKLSVEFYKVNDHEFENIWLSGPAELVFTGEIEIEAEG